MTVEEPVSRGLMEVTLLVVLAVCLLLAVVVVAAKIFGARRARARRDRLAPLRTDLLQVAAGEDTDGCARERLIAASTAADLERAVVDLLTKVRGEPAADLVEVLRRRDGVARAIHALGSVSSVHRARATRTLGLLRDPAHAERVTGMLEDRSREVRLVAARAVGALGPDAGTEAGTQVLRAVRSRGSAPGIPATIAIGTLTGLGPAAEPAVGAGLSDPDPGVRNVAAAVAGHNLFLSSAPRVAELATTDADRTVRVSATAALGTFARPEDVPVLAALLAAHEPAVVRRAAARALGEVGGPDAAQVLASTLGDQDRALAVTAADALAASAIGQALLQQQATDPDVPASARRAAAGAVHVLRLRAAASA